MSPTATTTDTSLQELVEHELGWDPSVHPASVGVSVVDGAVTLSGTVDSLSNRLAAVRAAKRVKGVRAVADDLVVKIKEMAGHSDHDLTGRIEHMLEWNSQIPAGVKAIVRNGAVTLEGTVEWNFQRRAAQRAIEYISGVGEVTNNITLRHVETAHNIHTRINAALQRYADLESDGIEVTSAGGEVWLRGTVHSWTERDRAENAAWAGRGVTKVWDELVIV